MYILVILLGSMQEPTKIQLKPILGIKAEVYTSFFWIILIGCVFFFLGIYPGIKYYGQIISFSSYPSGAAITVDGKYLGATPYESFISAGNHTIAIKKTFFQEFRQQQTIKGRRLLSLLFPSRKHLIAHLSLQDESGFVKHTLQNLSYSSGIKESTTYPKRPFLPQAIHNVLESTNTLKQKKAIVRIILRESIPYIITAQESKWYLTSLQDYLNITHESLRSFMQTILQQYRSLPPGLFAILKKYDWFDSLLSSQSPRKKNKSEEQNGLLQARKKESGNRKYFFSIPFRFVKGGAYLSPSYGTYSVPDFYIMEYPVTRSLFSRYGVTITQEKDTEEPYAHASWREVQELILHIPLPKGFILRLPEAVEWEYAYSLNGKIPQSIYEHTNSFTPWHGSIGIANLGGTLWEWTNTWYVEHPMILKNLPAYGYFKEVRGSSWITKKPSGILRGAQPPEWHSSFLGVRLIITRT